MKDVIEWMNDEVIGLNDGNEWSDDDDGAFVGGDDGGDSSVVGNIDRNIESVSIGLSNNLKDIVFLSSQRLIVLISHKVAGVVGTKKSV